MKKIITLVFVVMLVQANIACDMCGSYLSVNPNYNKNKIALRLRSSQYEGLHSHSNSGTTADGHNHTHSTDELMAPKTSVEQYFTYELYGRWYVKPKLQLYVSIPFADFYEKQDNKIIQSVKGVRDMVIIGMYQIANTAPTDSNKVKQRIFLGGGLKLPTGSFKNNISGDDVQATFQPGTGSLDFIFSGAYLVKKKQMSWSTSLMTSINTKNSLNYQFANRTNITSHLYYQLYTKNKKVAFMPFAGVYGEYADQDKHNGVTEINTGGNVTFGSVGFDVYWKNISVNLTYQKAIYENLYGNQGKNKNRIITGVSYVL